MVNKFNAKHNHQLVKYPARSLVMAVNLQCSKINCKFCFCFDFINVLESELGTFILSVLEC
jgi:hypothetical protein